LREEFHMSQVPIPWPEDLVPIGAPERPSLLFNGPESTHAPQAVFPTLPLAARAAPSERLAQFRADWLEAD
jgi:hypothetical protein